MPGLEVYKLLSAADLAELSEYARHPSRTVDQCHAWAMGKGYKLSRSAIYNWKRQLARNDRAAEISAASRAIMEAAREKGTAAVADAAILQLGSLIFEKTLAIQEGGAAKVRELATLAKALKNIITGKRYLEMLRTEVDEALKAAQKQRATPEQITAKMREILGIEPAMAEGN